MPPTTPPAIAPAGVGVGIGVGVGVGVGVGGTGDVEEREGGGGERQGWEWGRPGRVWWVGGRGEGGGGLACSSSWLLAEFEGLRGGVSSSDGRAAFSGWSSGVFGYWSGVVFSGGCFVGGLRA